MVSKIFRNKSRGQTPMAADTRNFAGGAAYSRTNEETLAQLITTSCFNGTFYSTEEQQLELLKQCAAGCTDEFLAKAAVYARKEAKMKDTPAFLMAVLASRKTEDSYKFLAAAWNKALDNQKIMRNFVQIMRSGELGRKSFGSFVRGLLRNWLQNQSAESLFKGSIGNNPSLADVLKMVHPKPENKEKEAFYGWLLNKKYNKRYLPKLVKQFEAYKTDKGEIPEVPFQMLTALELDKDDWTAIAENASWNTVRMNLNTFARHGVLDNKNIVSKLAKKLANRDEVLRNSVFPYQIMTSFINADVVPELKNALQDAMEHATENVPEIQGDMAVCVDTSGSMSSPITGHRQSSTTKTRCVDVAALIASTFLRKNPNGTTIVPFDTQVHMNHDLNGRDSIMTNASKLAKYGGGGTDCASALRYLNSIGHKGNLVVYTSDNESWYNGGGSYYRGTGVATEWAIYKSRNPKAKLVCIDLIPNTTVQAQSSKDILNIGGFSDSVFDVIAKFTNGKSTNFTQEIEKVRLTTE